MRKEFVRTTPEAVGIPSAAVEKLLDALEGSGHTQMRAMILMRRGKICAEGYWAPFGPGSVHADHSLTKTYTATAVGICEREGLLSLNQPVIGFFPDKVPAQPGDWLKKLTIRDLLMMGGGFPPEQSGYPVDWIERHLGAEIQHEPGTFWRYDSHGSTLLAAIVEKVTGMSMTQWLALKLFPVIGIDEQHILCRKTADGICNGGGGLFTTAEDNLRLMKLYLDGGVWDGVRILNEQFVRQATTRQLDNEQAFSRSTWIYDNRVGYGYQMWMCRPEGSYRADGAFGQFCIVVPSEDLIISIFEAGYNGEKLRTSDLHLPEAVRGEDRPVYGPQITLDIVFGILLPELQKEALAENPEAWQHLRERLSRLSMPRAWKTDEPDWTKHLPFTELEVISGGVFFGPMHGMGKPDRERPCADRICMKEEKGILNVLFHEGGRMQELKADLSGGAVQGILDYACLGEVITKASSSAWFTSDGVLHLSVLWYETEVENCFTFVFQQDQVKIEKTIVSGCVGAPLTETGTYRIVH